MRMTRSGLVMLAACAMGAGPLASAEVRVPSLIGNHMVLQQGTPARLWGWAEPGEAVRISVAGHTAQTTAKPDGTFRVEIGPLPAGGPYTLEVAATNTLRFEDVLVGEVWIASGQSNMEWPLARARDGAAEVAAATLPRVRLFTVPKVTSLGPVANITGEWVQCRPETAGDFSAVAYFFGRELARNLDVPIGLIHTSWGGTPAEAWTSREALTADPSLRPVVEEMDRLLADPEAARAYEREAVAWERANVAIDAGNTGEAQGFARPDFDDASWEQATLPVTIERLGHVIDGAIWFRRAVEVPADWAGRDLTLRLGAIDDLDETYFAGVKVGATGRDVPGFYTHQRVYRVPGALVKPGRNVIAVRVFDRAGDGGFTGPAGEMRIERAGGKGSAAMLSGEWRLKIEAAQGPFNPSWGSQPRRPDSENAPTMLYNAMLAPITPLAIRGAIWYQGESNASRALQYRTLFPAMIRDWRKAFGLGDFPFYYVQLANYMARATEPSESEWAELREAQTLTLQQPATGMAVAIDIGVANDIHPTNKQDVGWRLAQWALAKTYGRPVVPSGPLYRSHRVAGSEVHITFEHAAGLTARGDAPIGFAIAGTNRKFVWAKARIEGETVVVSSPEVAAPVAVRYGWADNPEVNLYNGAGLPASPFRTDDWPSATQTP